ncbi:hypothetical protein [Planctomycetes bacterium CA13]|uniref:hypothetical protein n=1 Tax=Novipirellula herctigrandis TaxID=2527986 RepID=UPI0011B4F33D
MPFVIFQSVAFVCVAVGISTDGDAADSRFSRADSDTRMMHHIDLYDYDNKKITAESETPYSPLMTCGRCHDYETISHGWHFNAFLPGTNDGRRGEPWIWTEPRTGTQLPLSYRDSKGLFNPNDLGVSPWEMTHQFGGRIPGGGVAANQTPAVGEEDNGEEDNGEENNEESVAAVDDPRSERWKLSGVLQIDCMVCHASPSVYDFNARRDAIDDENFAWSATAGLRLGTIDGNVSRIKDGSDPDDEAIQAKLPKVTYDARRFSPDGTVFMDLIRHPSNNACFQCHSQRTVDEHGIESRWIHDQDVHLRAGMQCSDCHRNGIDHNIVRGFEGESDQYDDPSVRVAMDTLTCVGCHIGPEHIGPEHIGPEHIGPEHIGNDQEVELSIRETAIPSRAGRLGSPMPEHAGLPAVHFERLACTACHSGPISRGEAIGMMTSFAHGLGVKEHRSGQELPRIIAPVYGLDDDGKIYPQRAVWPAFWGTVVDGALTPIDPSMIYDLTRKSLRVRKGFVEELVTPQLSRTELKEVLGEERSSVREHEWTDEEATKVAAAQKVAGEKLFNEKVAATLVGLQDTLEAEQAVYVSSGFIYRLAADGESLEKMDANELKNSEAVEMVSWPLAHSVRPAGWSLGVGGCLECHSDGSVIFDSTLQSVGPGPDQTPAITMAEVRGTSANQVLLWNQLFGGRKLFKFLIAGSIGVLCVTLLIGIGTLASNLVNRRNNVT